MGTTQNVLNLVDEYMSDRNCRADLWINDCFKNGEVDTNEKEDFLRIVMMNTWRSVFELLSTKQQEDRLLELQTWDKPIGGHENEHACKVAALKDLIESDAAGQTYAESFHP